MQYMQMKIQDCKTLEGAMQAVLEKGQPVPKAHQEMVEGILSSRYAFQVCDVIASARGEGVPGALLAYALAAMETDVERVRRLLRALRLLKEKGEASGVSPDQVEALQRQISEEVRRAYGGALLV